MIGLVSSVIPLAVIVVILVILLRARRGHEEGQDDLGIGAVRRLVLYGVGLVALVFAGVGLSLLIGGALDAVGGETVISESDTELAVALSFSVVGIPAWLLAAMVAQRSVRRARAAETGSQLRRWYLNLARGLALVLVVVHGIEAAHFILGVSDFDGGPWGWVAVWGAVWLVHDTTVRSEEPTTSTREIDHIYLAFASVFGLFFLWSGASAGLSVVASAAYDEAFRSTLAQIDWDEDVREALAVVVVGALVWVTHWILRLKRRPGVSVARQVVVFLFGVLPAVAFTVVPAAIGLYTALDWWIGSRDGDVAADHFSSLPEMVSAALVGIGAWVYFRSVIGEDQREGLATGEPERLYRYVVSAAGLAVVAAGLIAGLALAIEALTPVPASLLRSDDWWRDPLVLTSTLLAVGLPVWVMYWAGVQRTVARNDFERTVLSRRVYLFAIFGISSIASIVSLTTILFNFFDAWLGDGLTSAVIIDSRWGMAIVLSAGIVAVYHWAVLREDQPAAAAARGRRRPPRDVIVLASGDVEALLASLRDLEGVRVHVWRRALHGDGAAPLTPERIAALRSDIEQTEEHCLLIVAESGDVQFEPFSARAVVPPRGH